MTEPAGGEDGASPFSYSEASRRMRRSGVRDLLAGAAAPHVLSFAVGLPGSDLIPREALHRASRRLFESDSQALQYGTPGRALRAQIAELMAERGVTCTAEQVFLCSGAQQGLRLLARLLLDPGGSVVHERVIYDGFQAVISDLAPRLRLVASSAETGLDLDAFAAALGQNEKPAFAYVIPEGHNPLGVSLSAASRQTLAALAREHRVPIVEDDACGWLRYDEPGAPALRSFESRWVFYVGSFSKIVAPGLRVGWLVVPEEVISHLSALKHGTDFDSSTYAQHLVAEFLAAGELPRHLERSRLEYRRRRDAVVESLGRYFPREARWTAPQAGLYVWVELPEEVDACALLQVAMTEQRVAFTPGTAFAAPGTNEGRHALRLSFGNLSVEEIRQGIERLGRALMQWEGLGPSRGDDIAYARKT